MKYTVHIEGFGAFPVTCFINIWYTRWPCDSIAIVHCFNHAATQELIQYFIVLLHKH